MRSGYIVRRDMEHVLAALTYENRLVMEVCLHTGLRVGDVLRLRTAQLKPQFSITEEKTGKRRRVGLPAPLLAALKEQAGEEWVFEGRNDPKRHRTRQAVWKDVRRAAKAFRLPRSVMPHSARKLYAVQLLEKYGDLERVRRALNHDRIEVTMLYAMADKLARDRRKRSR